MLLCKIIILQGSESSDSENELLCPVKLSKSTSCVSTSPICIDMENLEYHSDDALQTALELSKQEYLHGSKIE